MLVDHDSLMVGACFVIVNFMVDHFAYVETMPDEFGSALDLSSWIVFTRMNQRPMNFLRDSAGNCLFFVKWPSKLQFDIQMFTRFSMRLTTLTFNS